MYFCMLLSILAIFSLFENTFKNVVQCDLNGWFEFDLNIFCFDGPEEGRFDGDSGPEEGTEQADRTGCVIEVEEALNDENSSIQLSQAKMAELKIFKGDAILIKGKKRK